MHELNELLSMGAADVSRTVRIAPASAVRARGDRRRAGLFAMAAAVVVAAVAATAAGAVVTGGGSLTSPGTGPPEGGIPAELKMPKEGEPGWRRDDAPDVGAEPTCGRGDPTLPGRRDARTLTGRVDSDGVKQDRFVQQLFLYESKAAARAAIDALVADLRACGWSLGDNPWSWPGVGEDGRQFLGHRLTGEGPDARGERASGHQLGNVVFLWHDRRFGERLRYDDPAVSGMNDVTSLGAQLCVLMRLCPPGTPAPPATPHPTGS
ncbi:MAG TPA: hypothetical protein VFR67_14000 [Pilimelia sp.]|nr:hypothetical protein [Pilimelia sp.]